MSTPHGVCKIHSNDGGGAYKVTQLAWNAEASAYDAAAHGLQGLYQAPARDIDNRPCGIVGGRPVPFWVQPRKGNRVEVIIDVGAAAGRMFAVKVWSDGGSDGDKTTQCSRTYTVRTIDATGPSAGGASLGSTVTPKKRRPSAGKLSCPSNTGAGEIGLGYYDDSGNFQLYDANETLAVEACS